MDRPLTTVSFMLPMLALAGLSCSPTVAKVDPDDFGMPDATPLDAKGRGTKADIKKPVDTGGSTWPKIDAGGDAEPVALHAFQRTYGGVLGDEGRAIAPLADGGHVVVGFTTASGATESDLLIVRTSSCGLPKWSRAWGGPDIDVGEAVATLGTDLVVAGVSSSFGPSPDIWVLRADEYGAIKWGRTYGGEYEDAATAVAVDLEGRIAVAARTQSFGEGTPGQDNLLVMLLDGAGKVAWQRTWGGDEDDTAFDIAAMPDATGKTGGYLIAGAVESWGTGADDVWLMRLDPSGKLQWSFAYGSKADEEGRALARAPDGGFVVAGFTDGWGATNDDLMAFKFDGGGKVNWAYRYGSAGHARAATMAPFVGGWVIGGRLDEEGEGDQGALLRINVKGAVIDSRFIGGGKGEHISGVSVEKNSRVTAIGHTRSKGAGLRDAWLLRDEKDASAGCKQGADRSAELKAMELKPARTTFVPPAVIGQLKTKKAQPAIKTLDGESWGNPICLGNLCP